MNFGSSKEKALMASKIQILLFYYCYNSNNGNNNDV